MTTTFYFLLRSFWYFAGRKMIIVFMGVSGSGKTTLGRELSKQLGWRFVDADDVHPEANILKMAHGIPLNDEDRYPWLMILHNLIASWIKEEISGIIACSALKKSYRIILQEGHHKDNTDNKKAQRTSAFNDILFIHLDCEEENIASRLINRPDHFMPPALLKSQFAALEPPEEDENCIKIEASNSISDSISFILNSLPVQNYVVKH